MRLQAQMSSNPRFALRLLLLNLLRMFNMQSHAARTVEHGLAVTNRLFPTCSLVLEKQSSTNRSSFFCLVVYTFVLCGELFISPCVQAICI